MIRTGKTTKSVHLLHLLNRGQGDSTEELISILLTLSIIKIKDSGKFHEHKSFIEGIVNCKKVGIKHIPIGKAK